ncbi:MAG: TetR family transcriptional regulator, partial [Chloroflexi bacterium]|nr:TetR family transcriptional regulator [Chloroflexota bacterium]
MTEQDTKAHILATATAVFAAHGFAKTSMNDIVKATGLSKGGV